MAAVVNLQRDAGIMLSNLQILSQFVTSLDRMSSEMMSGLLLYKLGLSANSQEVLSTCRGDYTAEGESSRARGPSGSRASSTTGRGTSSASDFYGRPIKGRRFGPTE